MTLRRLKPWTLAAAILSLAVVATVAFVLAVPIASADGSRSDALVPIVYDFGNGPEAAYEANFTSTDTADFSIILTVYLLPPTGPETLIAQVSDSRASTPVGPLSCTYRGPAGEVPPDSRVHAHVEARAPNDSVTYVNDRTLDP